MRIDQILATSEEPVFSFEFFPPRTEEGERTLQETLRTLRVLEPSFVSVTYGAGGSTRERTIELTKWIKRELGIEAMAHLSCVGTTREQLAEILDQVQAAGIDNVLALRGDPPRGETEWRPTPGGLSYSTELARLISDRYDFCIGAACFPEVHPEAPDLAHDIRFLKEKIAAEVRAAGIDLPIVPGIMPITNAQQIKRFTSMCGASIPPALLGQLELRGDDPDAVRELGVAYAGLQCADLLRRAAPGIHFYTLNRSPATRAIVSALRLHRPWAQRPDRSLAGAPAGI